MKKLQPAPSSIYFDIGTVADGATSVDYIDLSQCASLINRRFYRQGLNWAVGGFKFVCTPAVAGNVAQARIAIAKLPETWIMSNSWEKGFRAWQKMNNEALAETESVRPRFLDFKIYADGAHHSVGYGSNLLPLSADGSVATAGEWEPSKFVIPLGNADPGDTEEFEVIATGPSFPGNAAGSGFNAVSLIEGYANSRGLPNVLDPNAPDDASDSQGVDPENWIQALFNEGTDQSEIVLADMLTENNIAPYPFENDGVNLDTMYPGGETQLPGLDLHDLDNVSITTIGGMTRVKGGMFPCGLIKIATQNTGDASLVCQLIVDLVPGTHRGYLATPMTEM